MISFDELKSPLPPFKKGGEVWCLKREEKCGV